MPAEEVVPYTAVQFAIDSAKILFALSPLIALFCVIFTGFESEEEEKAKKRKADFQLDGHSE